jgi:excisionase family DNA binding protein
MFTVEEAAKHFKVTTKTIRNWIVEGRLKASKPGRHWRIPESAIRALSEGRVAEEQKPKQ